MTLRSVIVGLLGAMTVCFVTYFNDWVLRQTHFVGNNMPVVIYGSLIVFILFLNRLLRRLRLDGREIAVILALTLAACAIPGSGLMRTFPGSIIMPHHHNRLSPSWRQHEILSHVPPRMLVDISQDEDRVLDGYVQGLGSGLEYVSVSEIPWRAWLRPWGFWVPLALTMFLAVIGLSLVVHRQWADHEHLPYPLANFTASLLETDEAGRSSLWHNRIFWFGAIGTFAIHLNNMFATWFPDVMIPVRLSLDFSAASQLFPNLIRGGGGFVFRPRIFFAVIGLSFFISTQLAAAFGFGPWLWAWVAGIFAAYGIALNAPVLGLQQMGLQPRTFVVFGACVGIFLALLYSGRHYYLKVARNGIGWGVPARAELSAVWGFRLAVIMLLLFVFQLSRIGIDWQLAVGYTMILLVVYVVSARLMAEGGLFHIKIAAFPCAMLWGFFGSGALGFRTLLLLEMVTMVLFIDPRETLMPFMVNANKLLSSKRVAMGRVAGFAMVAVVLGMLVALPVTLYIQYNVPAATQGDTWAFLRVPRMPFENVVATKLNLESLGTLEEAEALRGWGRFVAMSPVRACLWAFLIGLALVCVASACRMRFAWWPIHPLIFVVWAKPHISLFAASFIIGWILKMVVMKYGGSQLYNRMKPLMLGLIAGEIIGAMTPSIIGTIYYFTTGNQPLPYVLYMG